MFTNQVNKHNMSSSEMKGLIVLFVFSLCCCGLVDKLYLTLKTPWTVACQAPLSIGFSRQEYWSRLPFLSPENYEYILITDSSVEYILEELK